MNIVGDGRGRNHPRTLGWIIGAIEARSSLTEISATIRLRPTRVALLVRPNDKVSLRSFMRVSACMWGGFYNPIIPVFRTPPKEWRPDIPERLTGAEIARGYVEFFEPDAFVEAEPGLLERVGLGAIRTGLRLHERVLSLDELLCCQPNRNWAELAFGTGTIDVLRHIYESERRFELRDSRTACLVKPERGSLHVEAMFGVYPESQTTEYIRRAFCDVYKPEEVSSGPETWRKVFMDGAETPRRVTNNGLQANRSWHHDTVVFIFDPAKTTDTIDLWNIRLEPNPVIPIPIDWLDALSEELQGIIRSEHRPVQGNPNGVMHSTTIEFARSIGEDRRDAAISKVKVDLPQGSWSYKTRRNPIWRPDIHEHMVRNRPLRVAAQEQHVSLELQGKEPTTASFKALSPKFAAMYGGGHDARWVNTVNVRDFGRNEIATVVPFNVTNPDWPRLDYLGERVVVGTEGWSFAQRFKDSSETIQFVSHEEAVIGSLKQLGVEARISEPGRIGKQILSHLGGMWGVNVLRDAETLRWLNRMAGGVRRRGNGELETEASFGTRPILSREWEGLMRRRQSRRALPSIGLTHFTDRNILRLGLVTKCPHCTAENWASLTAVDYEVQCERCLESYPFPQGELRNRNGNWSFRVIGPFATPDYARGTYSTLLTLDVLNDIPFHNRDITFAMGVDLKVDDDPSCEVDFVAWLARESFGEAFPPDLLIGETKSFGEGDLIKLDDLRKLRRVAVRFPGAIIVISVMRDTFTETEKEELRRFVRWARRPNKHFEPTNPVLLLTGTELFHEMSVGMAWKAKGDPHAKFTDFHHTDTLRSLAEATQTIYLDLPSFHEEQIAAARHRKAK